MGSIGRGPEGPGTSEAGLAWSCVVHVGFLAGGDSGLVRGQHPGLVLAPTLFVGDAPRRAPAVVGKWPPWGRAGQSSSGARWPAVATASLSTTPRLTACIPPESTPNHVSPLTVSLPSLRSNAQDTLRHPHDLPPSPDRPTSHPDPRDPPALDPHDDARHVRTGSGQGFHPIRQRLADACVPPFPPYPPIPLPSLQLPSR